MEARSAEIRGRLIPDCAALHPGYALQAATSIGGAREQAVDIQEIRKIEAYLRRLFGNPKIRIVPRPKKDDSAEVYIGDEFIGVIFVDEEEKDSYNFNMSILGVDLE
jgi:Protein of unknown function (DUF3126)